MLMCKLDGFLILIIIWYKFDGGKINSIIVKENIVDVKMSFD